MAVSKPGHDEKGQLQRALVLPVEQLELIPVRFGVAGTAHWARTVHIPGLLATENAELIGVWGRTLSSAQALAERHGIRAFARFQDMLGEVDAVTIAVQPQAQPELAIAAANAGKHLILEKPLALDTAAADAVAAATEGARVASLVFFMRRFVPEIESVISAERMNGWTHAEARVHSPAMSIESPYRGSLWRQEPGAALWDMGPHVLSVLIPMMGPVTEIEARTAETRTILLRTLHETGGTAKVSLTLHSSPDQAANYYQFRSGKRELVLPNPAIQRPDAFRRAATRLIANVESGEHQDELGVRLGVETVRLLAQAARMLQVKSQVAS